MDIDSDQELIELRKRIRHSTAHVMADVVTNMFPDAKLAIGPPTDDGFYYDFLVEEPFTDDILGTIENSMKRTSCFLRELRRVDKFTRESKEWG